MWSAQSGCVLARALVLAVLCLAVAGRPLARRPRALSDQGPHLKYGWGQSIRLRHLYAAGPNGLSNCFLRIHSDGTVGCEEDQSEHSLLEIRAVDLKTVAIKDINSVRYLCMSADGKMQGLAHYSQEDCAFKEEINYSGYNVYSSPKHRLFVALNQAKARQQVPYKGTLLPSYFLPMLPKTSEKTHDQLESALFPLPLDTDSMDPLRMLMGTELVQSPSFEN